MHWVLFLKMGTGVSFLAGLGHLMDTLAQGLSQDLVKLSFENVVV